MTMNQKNLTSDERMLQAFRVIRERLDAGAPSVPLEVLRQRLEGELLGDARRVAATLAADFGLVTHAGGLPMTLAGSDLVAGISLQAETGAILWTELDDLVVEEEVIAGDGLFHTFQPDLGSVTTFPLAFFIRYADGLMTSEVAFMAVSATVTTTLSQGAAPSRERLASLL
jgi:hypothetical protein